jgi:ubiquinol-cytochrome c reductase cytochrome b subunit
LFKRLSDWLESRTGYRGIVHEALEEPIPGGARWRYVFGSALTATFAIQLVTGLLLMTSYSPSSTTAWGSVFYITYGMSFGWFLRGVHHFGSQAMVVLLVLHLLQVVIAGAYRAPREVNWWFGVLLMLVTLGLSLTGYLLPWDQKGFWATNVATEIAGGTPVLGPQIQKFIVGGGEYGNQTLTRFYALHVFLLPLLLIVFVSAHVALFRKHGVTHPKETRGIIGKFWPEQMFLDVVASALVLAAIVGLVLYFHGADLDAPADPTGKYPARPEWYFLSLFQFLKKLSGKYETLGALGVPGAIMTVMLLLPLFDRVFPKRLAHFLACAFIFSVVGGAVYLTVDAIREDERDVKFKEDRIAADKARERALELASEQGIPPRGAAYLLTEDPRTNGLRVLQAQCLGCHYYGGKGRESQDEKGVVSASSQVAPDLKDAGSRAWIRGLLENPKSATYFGKVPGCDGMGTWKQTSKLKGPQLDAVADFVATFAAIPADVTPEEWANDPKVLEHPGFKAFSQDCLRCHIVGRPGLLTGDDKQDVEQDAPNLFAYGSKQWLTRMINKPGAVDRYGFLEKEHQMPPFLGQLSENDLETVIRYLKNDYLGAPGQRQSGTANAK